MTKIFVPAIFLAAALVGPAASQTAPAPTQAPAPEANASEDNFTFAPARGEHLKIDRRTGRVSLCKADDGVWQCRLVPDDRIAYEEEVEALRAENQRLQERVAELEEMQRSERESSRLFGPEDEKKIDEFMDFSGHAMRRFFDMVEDLKRDFENRDRT